MHPTDELIPILKKLRLSGVLQTLEVRTRQAVDDDLSHSEFLLRLLTDEVERRDARQLELRLRRASFEHLSPSRACKPLPQKSHRSLCSYHHFCGRQAPSSRVAT